MSEESKTPDGDYVMMGANTIVPGRGNGMPIELDDPSLTQEEKDHRLAVALQKQENTAAYQEHKKKHDAYVQSQNFRTLRSGTFTKLAAVRDKDHGMLSVPAAYSTEDAYKRASDDGMTKADGYVAPAPGARPQEIADFKLAAEMQKVEQIDAGTVRTMEKIVKEEVEEDLAQAHRTERSNFHINQKGLFHK
ncbi:hypothetical protein FisN_19Hh083 [Fistulifera solaris]|jgi:hypothetical protein|uniref:Uncharacterized protein n=1 Tax=Fistulifera solaris TaxID=1519565 RepID=A0A1Z5K0D3_FISSO|nr:hypothetical protein FisN_19Hh083 [Fistulifera solaris]|eukprot:GAX19508.1 hypothetical protein FisN_19Hh083 [Fistulifera solaris]